MNALAVLYGGGLTEAAYEPVFSGKSALALALEQAAAFPDTRKVLLLTQSTPIRHAGGLQGVELVVAGQWTKQRVLNTLAREAEGFDCTYFAWADCPFLDTELAKVLAERHLQYAAEYSYADGWPYGLAPELLAPGVGGILAKILGDADGPVERDILFSVIQKDINAFDIETVLSPVDLRGHRLSLTADSKRNLLLLTRFMEAGFSKAQDVEVLIREKPELLRTLPNFFHIQAAGPCPQRCILCPYPGFQGAEELTQRTDFLDSERFEALLGRIVAFAGDGVIDLSLWGELSLHPEKLELIRRVLARPELSLIIETSGLGWKPDELERLAVEAQEALPRRNGMAPVSWILALDAQDPARYREIRGNGYAEALATTQTLTRLFPQDAYVQAVRVKGFEDDIEQFYRFWKEAGARIIIQKYDHFCGVLPALGAADLSPVKRQPCWHLLRDMVILLNGTVPCCREDLAALTGTPGKGLWGNVFSDPLETIWSRGGILYEEQCIPAYTGICAGCDEYYTYNF
ncbi:MAG: spiro-SPASM protein [Spirochaetaceae bacterium]|jgi:spiro-SPASM protein|nr:spiro-SPASM protein [Spirochaetaceae bacterium]